MASRSKLALFGHDQLRRRPADSQTAMIEKLKFTTDYMMPPIFLFRKLSIKDTM